MNTRFRHGLVLFLLAMCAAHARAQESEPDPDPEPERIDTVNVTLYFQQNVSTSDALFRGNGTHQQASIRQRNPFYMSAKTNLLYDAALVPNISAEFYLGRRWAIGGTWMYAWWKSDRVHNYWRTYGGELDIRKYFGSAAMRKPLTGHHLGLYLQGLTYDFELGGTGYLSYLSYGAGIEYGYSLPIARRLNLDFGIGVGYLGGEYKVYDPIEGCYVWRETRQRHWFGPTKAEISLVWLIGWGNYNEKKGGAK